MTGTPRPRRLRDRRATALAILVLLVGGVTLIRATVAFPVRIDSASMMPTFSAGDVVLVSRTPPRLGDLHHGDLVVFASPQDGERTLKRARSKAGVDSIREGFPSTTTWSVRPQSGLSGQRPERGTTGPTARFGVICDRGASASLRGHQFDTVLGPLNFDKNSDVTTQSVILYDWRGGQYMPLE